MPETNMKGEGAAIIRTATAEDAALLAAVGAETFFDAYESQLSPESLAAFVAGLFSPEMQAGELADPGYLFLILEVDGTTAGYAALRDEAPPEAKSGERALELARIYLRQPWIGRGLGSALMQASLDAASRKGFPAVWLAVWEHNARALSFYERWGFEQMGAITFEFGDELQTDLVLVRRLDEQGTVAPDGAPPTRAAHRRA